MSEAAGHVGHRVGQRLAVISLQLLRDGGVGAGVECDGRNTLLMRDKRSGVVDRIPVTESKV